MFCYNQHYNGPFYKPSLDKGLNCIKKGLSGSIIGLNPKNITHFTSTE
jgi:hypothetical protein